MSYTLLSLPAGAAPSVHQRRQRMDPDSFLCLKGSGRGSALPRPALPYPAQRSRQLRGETTGWIGGARGRRGVAVAPIDARGARCLLACLQREALDPRAGLS